MQNASARVPENIVAGHRTRLETLGIANEHHIQLVDVFTQVRIVMKQCVRGGGGDRERERDRES